MALNDVKHTDFIIPHFGIYFGKYVYNIFFHTTHPLSIENSYILFRITHLFVTVKHLLNFWLFCLCIIFYKSLLSTLFF